MKKNEPLSIGRMNCETFYYQWSLESLVYTRAQSQAEKNLVRFKVISSTRRLKIGSRDTTASHLFRQRNDNSFGI